MGQHTEKLKIYIIIKFALTKLLRELFNAYDIEHDIQLPKNLALTLLFTFDLL